MKPFHLLLLALVLLLGWLQYRLWLGNGGMREVEALQAQVALQHAENLKLRQRNDALAAEVENLKSGESAVEERARSELGMVKPGETFYRVIEDTPATRPHAPQAQATPTATQGPDPEPAPEAPSSASHAPASQTPARQAATTP